MGSPIDELPVAQEHLDNFEKIHNLRTPHLPNESIEALELTYEELTKLTPTECSEYAFILEQYALYLQRINNKEHASLEWLINELEKIICDKLNNFPEYTKYETKIKLIAKENAVVEKLLQQINYTKQKISRLEYIPSSIKSVAKALDNIRQTKLAIIRGNYGTN